MPLSRNQLKYLASLKNRKFRNMYHRFLIEGDKIIRDVINNRKNVIRQIIATRLWLHENNLHPSEMIGEILETDESTMTRISSLETPPGVIAVLDIPETSPDHPEIISSLSLVLDTIQDPGNMGTIIRTADWFGIRNIFCSEGCADCFGPKVVQASMGAVLNVKVHYQNIPGFLAAYSGIPDFMIYGATMEGENIFDCGPIKRGMVVFGNESRGISKEISSFIHRQITIPPVGGNQHHVESLNVASAVAIACSMLTHKK
jgi:TrmH family RNA methyltransferase